MIRHRRGSPVLIAALLLWSSVPATAAETTAPIVLENAHASWAVGPDGRVVRFSDAAGRKNYLDAAAARPIARVQIAGKQHGATAVTKDGDQWRIAFGETGVTALIKPHVHDRYFLLEVSAVEGTGVEVFTFVDIPLTLTGADNETFAACALALNLKTNVDAIPGPMSGLRAMCYPKFGFPGARVALIGCPRARLREFIQQTVSDAPDLPHSPIGGPWALDAPINHGSYLMDLGAKVTEDKVDDWIKLAGNLGIKQIDFHTGVSFRFGDYEPNPDIYPRGRAGAKAVIDKLHAAGILAGLHTYAFFIAKTSPYVTPKPDPRLASDAVFTLTEDLPADATHVPVAESTGKMSNITGFFIRNSVTLRIDDELIVYQQVVKQPPYAFTECQRGAYGTKAAAHTRGAKVHHLKECFGLFVPDVETTMFEEIAQKTADTYNDCGFDMIYLDALDGSDIHAGTENAWYYGSKFVFELARRIRKPALFEMSTFHHHLWYVRSRMGAWDVPSRGVKKFIDVHTITNRGCARMFLPSNLGWWGIFPWSGVQPERSMPDDIEYLCGKALGHDSSLSLLVGFSPEEYAAHHNSRRLGAIFRQYEELRLSKYFPESVKAKLRVRGDEYTLEQDAEKKWRFRPVHYEKHKFQGLDGASEQWTVNNRHAAQPLRVRIEALQAAGPYEAPENPTLAVFDSADEFSGHAEQSGVTGAFEIVREPVKAGAASARLTALSTHDRQDASWIRRGKVFSPLANIKDRGLGLWIHGDAGGQVLNLQVQSAEHMHGAIASHLVPIDFEGWRYFELIEPTTSELGRYDWPYFPRESDWDKPGAPGMSFAYPNMHLWVMYEHIEHFNIWLNNLPKGRKVECLLSPIKAIPLKSVKLKNPAITIGGKRLVFPVELETGSYIEFNTPTDCVLYDATGERAAELKPQGDLPTVAPGANDVSFTCEPPPDARPRALITIITRGDAI